MSRSLAQISLAALCLFSAGCVGRPGMVGGSPYGQPQYVTVPAGAPGPVASPQPILTPVPISTPQPNPTPGPVASPPTDTPTNGGGELTLTPAARSSAWYGPGSPVGRNPTTFAPSTFAAPGARYAEVGRTIDGRPVSLNGTGAQSARPLKAALRKGSQADRNHRRNAGRIGQLPQQSQIVSGLNPTPNEDLKFRGGKTIKDLTYINIYVGGKAAWAESDRKNIDWALNGAMTDPYLNHVVMQYFNDQPVTASYRGSFILDGFRSPKVTQPQVKDLTRQLYSLGYLKQLPLSNTIVNFMLPRGVILADPDEGGQQTTVSSQVIPHEEESSSLEGLGGYYGSVHIGADTVYYAVGAYSERLPNGKSNGIPVFDQSWKNIVATFYHELQEARTDPDVDDAITTGQERYVGWTSDSGEEIGDFPVEADGQDGRLDQVFIEVTLANKTGKVPVQLCYSNAVHGPEGQITAPHRGAPLPIPPGSPPPWAQPGPSPTPAPQPNPQPTNPPPSTGGDTSFETLRSEWDHLPEALKQRILDLIKASHMQTDEHIFGK